MHDDTYDYKIVDDRIHPIIVALTAKFEELRHVEAGHILCVLSAGRLGPKHASRLADIAVIPTRWSDILAQHGRDAGILLTFSEPATANLDTNQMKVLIYRMLLQIDKQYRIIPPDTQEWRRILDAFGRKWYYPAETCPDILDEAFDWKRVLGDDYAAVIAAERTYREEGEE